MQPPVSYRIVSIFSPPPISAARKITCPGFNTIRRHSNIPNITPRLPADGPLSNVFSKRKEKEKEKVGKDGGVAPDTNAMWESYHAGLVLDNTSIVMREYIYELIPALGRGGEGGYESMRDLLYKVAYTPRLANVPIYESLFTFAFQWRNRFRRKKSRRPPKIRNPNRPKTKEMELRLCYRSGNSDNNRCSRKTNQKSEGKNKEQMPHTNTLNKESGKNFR